MIDHKLIPAYADGYEIRFDRPSDTFRCFQNDTRLKNNGKSFAPKSLDRAKKFMAELGAEEVAKKPKLWTPPPAAVIAPLEEQLAALPLDTPRFVVIEKGYGNYHEQGYAVYDREEKEIVSAHTYNGWNGVTQSREEAEKEAAYRQEHPPVKVEYDVQIFNAMIAASDRYERRFSEPLPSRTPPAKTEMTFITDVKHSVGEIITDEYNRAYRVVKESYYFNVSDRDVADLEDQDIFGVSAGWQTETRLVEE